jgi:hypothetical protein
MALFVRLSVRPSVSLKNCEETAHRTKKMIADKVVGNDKRKLSTIENLTLNNLLGAISFTQNLFPRFLEIGASNKKKWSEQKL